MKAPNIPDNPTITIAPEYTAINDRHVSPTRITLILESGRAYSIEEIVEVMTIHDKKSNKTKRVPFARARRFGRALKTALRESLDEDEGGHPAPTK